MVKISFKQFLKMEIENKRKDMYKKAMDLGFTHPSVVDCSQELDVLLNKYSKAINKAS
ncbi:aspartyl-phosphate phosphatase Spo0E family protein [Lysinibacillus sp. CTST325]|uniref:Spo0E family sporulation regulatory protein-aspartic acid phosphatase n=2 Tax=Lysinibacillus xylanilyticus TaxID=582475 RepID=A0A2M9QAM7_9BACI|nr:Spo0E family sporulation regulatory protein-aspartic acid phosphatase [Lysinibacillus xylanilyticus]